MVIVAVVALEGGVPVDRRVGKGKAFWEVRVWFLRRNEWENCDCEFKEEIVIKIN